MSFSLASRCLPKAPAPIQPRHVRVAAPVLSVRHQKRSTVVVRAAEPEEVVVGDDDELFEEEIDINFDPRAEQRELREDRRQSGRGGRGGRGGGEGRGGREQKEDDGFEDKIIQLNRVTKVLKGGKLMRFRAVVVVGDKKGTVGMGIASAREIVDAVLRATAKAKASAIRVPVTPSRSFPHKIQIKKGSSIVMLRPASQGTGVIAGGSVRVVLELAGYQNGFGKIYGTASSMNNAAGAIEALAQMRTWKQIAAARGVTMDYAMGRVSEPHEIAAR